MRLVDRTLEKLGNQVTWRFTRRIRLPMATVEVNAHLSVLFIQRDQLLLIESLFLLILILKLLCIQFKSSSLLPLHLFGSFQRLQFSNGLRMNLIH